MPLKALREADFCLLFILVIGFTGLLLCREGSAEVASDAWDDVFNQRSDGDWRTLWHVERHRRCFQELESHMKWVCQKDIYKVIDKRHPAFLLPSGSVRISGPFLSRESAHNLLGSKTKRRAKRGIMDECCQGPAGCSWEEYAEYCQHHSRIRV